MVVGGREKVWQARITEQEPDRSIAWQSTSGLRTAGRVSLEALTPSSTRITVRLSYELHGLKEHIGQLVGVVESAVQNDLGHFKDYLERLGQESGAMRGVIHAASR